VAVRRNRTGSAAEERLAPPDSCDDFFADMVRVVVEPRMIELLISGILKDNLISWLFWWCFFKH
jgi:hypothetical protein